MQGTYEIEVKLTTGETIVVAESLESLSEVDSILRRPDFPTYPEGSKILIFKLSKYHPFGKRKLVRQEVM
jgi:hypothetical protein